MGETLQWEKSAPYLRAGVCGGTKKPPAILWLHPWVEKPKSASWAWQWDGWSHLYLSIWLQLSHPLYFVLLSANSCFLRWYSWYCHYYFFEVSIKEIIKAAVFSYFPYLLVCFCSKENRSKLVDCYLHSCIYFTNLCNYFMQTLVSHRKKIWTQNILLLVLAEQWCKEGSSAFLYSRFCCIILYSSTKCLGCYWTSPVMLWVPRSLGLSLFVLIASNFEDSFSFCLGDPHFTPV